MVPILGLATTANLNFIKCISAVNVSGEQFLSEFSKCFGEIGILKNTRHIEIKDKVTPVVTPVRKIPLALEKEWKRMVDLDIIESVQKLNKVIKREHLHLPNAEEIFSQMSRARQN